MTGDQRSQLETVGEVHRVFERNGIDHWLFGGWAVDFHAGRVTRSHDDLDLAVWSSAAARIARLLEQNGWVHAPDPYEDGGTGYARGDVRLELTFLVPRADGTAAVPLRRGDVPFVQGVLTDELRELDGVPCRVVSMDALVAMKSALRDEPDEQAKDAADLVALRVARRRE